MISEQELRLEQARAVEAQGEEPIYRQDALFEEITELTMDALQCDTDASEFLIRELRDGEFGPAIQALIDFSDAPTVTSIGDVDRWYEGGAEPVGG